jgi:UDP-N-acetylglucosamine--N-acetylmuramyl-(pentapeptide) pyrophosphoryl-undecaprenol N-acetylglucosamine transferase
MELVRREDFRAALGGWQVFHLSGDKDVAELTRDYAAAKVPARVLPFCDAMGLAWGSATLAISRAGAGSVGEAWANAVPTLFFPYPYHRDQHQKLNALPLTHSGAGAGAENVQSPESRVQSRGANPGAVLLEDLIDPAANAAQTGPVLMDLIADAGKRQKMAAQLRATRPADGASAVADWLAGVVG